jgi:aminoglycoside 3-N-acetyltransferase
MEVRGDMKEQSMLSVSDIEKDIRRIGIRRGDMVYLHSSLKKIGRVENGPAAIIEAILECIGDEGTLAMPSHSLNYPGSVNAPYDKYRSPGVRMGVVSETFRQWPGTLRSDHPTHSSIALGKMAQFLTAGHNLQDPFDRDSPLYRFYEANGKILLLGVGHDRNTSIHLAEAIIKSPYNTIRCVEEWAEYAKMIDPQGKELCIRQINFPGDSTAFSRLEGMLYYRGFVKYGMVGAAVSMVMYAKDIVDFTLEVLKNKPDFLLCYDSACTCCPRRRQFLENTYGAY